jgi:hypothetical protein
MCVNCYEKSDHTGHRVWLKTNVSGCCDCGDPDGFDERGFCTDHKGYAASSEAMISSLPTYIKEASYRVFGQLMSSFKMLMLQLFRPDSNKALLQNLVKQMFLLFQILL